MPNSARIILTEGDAPSTPPSGTSVVYIKSDHKLYTKDSSGNEYGCLNSTDLDPSTGHSHTGTDSKKVKATNLDVTGLTAGKPLQVNSGGTAIESASDTGSGAVVRATSPTITSPTLVTPALGTPASGDLQNCIGGIHYKTSTTLEGQDGKTITHNKGDTNYYVLVSPKDVVIPNVGDIWVVKSSNTAVVYNSGVSGISADISVIKTA